MLEEGKRGKNTDKNRNFLLQNVSRCTENDHFVIA
jgi:hypothetical protein